MLKIMYATLKEELIEGSFEVNNEKLHIVCPKHLLWYVIFRICSLTEEESCVVNKISGVVTLVPVVCREQ
jgi:hypothetical protein